MQRKKKKKGKEKARIMTWAGMGPTAHWRTVVRFLEKAGMCAPELLLGH